MNNVLSRRRNAPVVSRFLALLVVLTVAGGCVTASPPSSPPSPSSPPVVAERQMIAAAHPLAAAAGLEMLRAGGSAVDATIAAAMVLTLVEPQSSGIGGGGFLVHHDAGRGQVAAYDGRETAPAAADPGMFLDADGRPRAFDDVVAGGLSVGTPGLLRMLETAHRAHGRLPWATLFQPAIGLAEAGFPVSPRLHAQIAADRHLRASPPAARYFFDRDGRPRAVGVILRNPELAKTLRTVAAGGADAFYKGAIARDIAAAVRTAPRNPGALSTADLAAYRARTREPVCGGYRLWRICGMPPPSSGGVAILQILGILEGFDLAHNGPDDGLNWHRVVEASRLAFADRGAYLADPDVVAVPTAALLDPAYLAARRALITDRAMPTVEPGAVPVPAPVSPQAERVGASTSHLSVVDGAGNAVALTASIESAFGSRIMVRGFLLNNQLTDFAFAPERDGRAVANRAGPGTRPLSSMAPTLVFDDLGRPLLVAGSPGGARIIGYVVKTLLGALDWRLSIQDAIDRPNILSRTGPVEIEAGRDLAALQEALVRRGHVVEEQVLTSGVQAVAVTAGGLMGGADRRREGVAVGD